MSTIIETYVDCATPLFRSYDTKSHCLNGTRVCIDALAHFGVRARPVSVQCMAVNRIYADKMAGFQSSDDFPSKAEFEEWFAEGAWSVGIDTRDGMGGWPGHLIAIADDHLIDSAAGQFDRPQHGIYVPDIFHSPLEGVLSGKPPTAIFVNQKEGCVLTYTLREKDKTYRKIRGFQRSAHNREITDLVIKKMNARLLLAGAHCPRS